MINNPKIYIQNDKYIDYAKKLADKINTEIIFSNSVPSDELAIVFDENDMKLVKDDLSLKADLSEMVDRIKKEKITSEFLIKAAKIKNKDNITIIDATAGLGDDSFVFAAYGYNVIMFEYNPIIASLLRFSLENAKEKGISEITSRMTLIEGDSIQLMKEYSKDADIIFLDPMFPERQKNALVKKKFQLLQNLEMPCANENDLFNASIDCNVEKIVVKRPAKGPNLSSKKPSFSLDGKAIRYDCYLYPQNAK